MKKNSVQFSKIITTAFAAFMFPLSVYVIVRCLDLAQMAVERGFTGALPYVTAIVGFVQAAVVIVLGCYFDNSKKEKVAKAQYSASSIKRDC